MKLSISCYFHWPRYIDRIPQHYRNENAFRPIQRGEKSSCWLFRVTWTLVHVSQGVSRESDAQCPIRRSKRRRAIRVQRANSGSREQRRCMKSKINCGPAARRVNKARANNRKTFPVSRSPAGGLEPRRIFTTPSSIFLATKPPRPLRESSFTRPQPSRLFSDDDGPVTLTTITSVRRGTRDMGNWACTCLELRPAWCTRSTVGIQRGHCRGRRGG